MRALTVKINKEEMSKVDAFIKDINQDENMAAYAIDDTTMSIVTTGDLSMAYVEALLELSFIEPVVQIIK